MSLHPEAEFLFTSESVNEGHPDKLADQVRGEGRVSRRLPIPAEADGSCDGS